mmetsp:Transcript_1882/g.4915  ORF Transcript_1882/g.4915 Transcript_1882/m.4915 type:complete len:436 (+) Transcript_1882:181-1488(+)
MDLLGDLGAVDQLTSARAENEVLREQVKALKQRCSVLAVENESLKAEVEIYRSEAASSSSSLLGSSQARSSSAAPNGDGDDRDHFVRSGNGRYARSSAVNLENLHGASNVLTCSLSKDDSVLATGGADRKVSLTLWKTRSADVKTVVDCDAPVIAVDFARHGRNPRFVAAGCMDGSVHVVYFETDDAAYTSSSSSSPSLRAEEIAPGTIKHGKYVRCLAWSSSDDLLATASADGSVKVHRLDWNLVDGTGATLEPVQTLQLGGPVESICFREDVLCCYARGSSNLSCFDLRDDFAQRKINLNRGPGNKCFDDHVSFAVMDMTTRGDYLGLATDSSRNIVMDWRTGHQVRNLYGHKNDGYSQPRLAWSGANSEYLYGNSQHENAVCVWDLASSKIVERLEGHSNTVRDMFASETTDTLVTTSFDKTTRFWTVPDGA